MAGSKYIVWCSLLVLVLVAATDAKAASHSFADAVTDYSPVFTTDPPGNTGPRGRFVDPLDALGSPDWNAATFTGAVSLGVGGSITLEFTDNVLFGSGDSNPDLFIHEIGDDPEATFVAISMDGITFHDVGMTFGGMGTIDIDAFAFVGPGDTFTHVRVTDDPLDGDRTGSEYSGADIDAIQTGPEYSGADIDVIQPPGRERAVPEPLTMLSVLAGLSVAGRYARRRRLG